MLTDAAPLLADGLVEPRLDIVLPVLLQVAVGDDIVVLHHLALLSSLPAGDEEEAGEEAPAIGGERAAVAEALAGHHGDGLSDQQQGERADAVPGGRIRVVHAVPHATSLGLVELSLHPVSPIKIQRVGQEMVRLTVLRRRSVPMTRTKVRMSRSSTWPITMMDGMGSPADQNQIHSRGAR